METARSLWLEDGAIWPRPRSCSTLSASIKNLGALAGLLGSPFDEMTGRMSLSSSISGQEGKLGGYLSMEGSNMGFRKHPIESGRVEVAFANTEAQIAQCELWSGGDYLRAKGAVDIASPHNYSGEVQASLRDIASYVDLVRPVENPRHFRRLGPGTLAG